MIDRMSVDRSTLEAELAALTREVPDPRAGIYGPSSVSWRGVKVG